MNIDTSPTNAIIEKIDQLLEDDDNFSTRTGLRFMTTVMREALQVIGDVADSKGSTITRLTNLEKALTEFLNTQKERRQKDETERGKWRWAIITPSLAIIILEIFKWITGK